MLDPRVVTTYCHRRTAPEALLSWPRHADHTRALAILARASSYRAAIESGYRGPGSLRLLEQAGSGQNRPLHSPIQRDAVPATTKR